MDSENRNQINISMDIPNDLVERIANQAESSAISKIQQLAKNKILKSKYSFAYGYGGVRTTKADAEDSDPLQGWVKDMVKELLEDNKDLIIEKAAHELAMSMSRSKTVRDKFADRLEEIVDG